MLSEQILNDLPNPEDHAPHRAFAIAQLKKILVGLEPLSDQQAAAYLTANAILLCGIPYLVNEITTAIIAEVRNEALAEAQP